MRLRIAILIFGMVAAGARFALAQDYGAHAPIPKSTSLPALRQAAQAREIRERFVLGLDAERRAAWGTAAPEFERILQLTNSEPQHSTAAYDLALAYAGMGRLDDAARLLHAAIAADDAFLAAYANLISIDLQRRNLREARTIADRFVALAPDSARSLYSRGLVALQSGDAPAAALDFGRLLQNNPSYAVAHYDLGLAEVRERRTGEARREFETALSLAPTYARARFALATVLLKEGHRAEARAALDTAIRDAASDPALKNLAEALRATL